MTKYELNYGGFEQYLFEVQNPNIMGKATYLFMFENGLGAYVGAWGKTKYRTLWNVSLLIGNKDDYKISWYGHPVCPDIVMYLTDEDVHSLLTEIKDFK